MPFTVPYKFKRTPVILSWNHKGGVGKTQIGTIGLGGALAKQGYRVIVIDADSQINASLYFQQGVGRLEPFDGTLRDYIDSNGSVSANDILRTFTFCRTPGSDRQKDFFYVTEKSKRGTVPAPEGAKPATRTLTMSLVPGDSEIGGANLENMGIMQQLIADLDDGSGETIFILDAPPQLMPIMNPALFCANYLVTPVLASNDSIYGIPTVLSVMQEVRQVGFDIQLLGVFVNNYDKREAVPRELAAQLRASLKGTDTHLFETAVRHSSLSERARSLGIVPQVADGPLADFNVDLWNLATEVVRRIEFLEKQ